VTRAHRIAIAFPILALLAGASVAAVRLGTAGDAVYAASAEVARWADTGQTPAREAVAELSAAVETAREAAPFDANAEELLGRLSVLDNAKAGFLDDAMGHYGRALALRPTSPYTWAAVVEALYRKGDTGPRFWLALDRAAGLGPEEPAVQRVVADYGLALWDEAGPQARKTVEAAVTAEMKRGSRSILQVAERRGRLAVACRHMGEAPRPIDLQWLILCSREGTT
jgi:hypothetical protein